MSSVRGRAVKTGGVATEPAGYSVRTDQALATRPAYASPGGGTSFTPVGVAPAVGGGGGHPLLDFSGVTGWRLVFTAAALFYLGFWFFTISRGGIVGGIRP